MEIIMKKLLAFVLAIVLMMILPACGERVQGNSSVCTDSTTETCDATTKYLRMEDAAECVVRAVVVSTEMATPFEQTATLDVIKVYKGETADRIKLYQSSDSPLVETGKDYIVFANAMYPDDPDSQTYCTVDMFDGLMLVLNSTGNILTPDDRITFLELSSLAKNNAISVAGYAHEISAAGD